jgi:hypothetical protein
VLEAHLAIAPDLSFLALRGGNMITSINTVDKNLILVSLTLTESHYRKIFLIFDAVDNSLRVIPALPRDLHLNRTSRLLAIRHHDDDGGIDTSSSYSLVIPGSAVTSISDQDFAEMVQRVLHLLAVVFHHHMAVGDKKESQLPQAAASRHLLRRRGLLTPWPRVLGGPPMWRHALRLPRRALR